MKSRWGFQVPIRNGDKIKLGFILMITDGPGGFGNYLQGIFFTYIFVHFLMFLWKTNVLQNIFVVNSYIWSWAIVMSVDNLYDLKLLAICKEKYMTYKCTAAFQCSLSVFFHLYWNCINCDTMCTSNKMLIVSCCKPPTVCGNLFTWNKTH